MVTERTAGLSTEWFKKRLTFLKDVQLGRKFTPEEARAEFGIELEPDWSVKVEPYEPAESGYAYTYITPEGWEIRPDETYVSPAGETFTREELETQQAEYEKYQEALATVEPYKTPEGLYDIKAIREAGISEDVIVSLFGEAPLAAPPAEAPIETEQALTLLSDVYAKYPGYKPEEIPQTIANLQEQLRDDPAGFLEDLYLRTTPENAEAVLRMLGVPEENVVTVAGAVEAAGLEEERMTQTIQAVFPDFDIEDLANLLEENPTLFWEKIQTGDSRVAKRQLLEVMGYEPEEINRILSIQKLVLPVDGVRKQVVVDMTTQRAYDVDGKPVGSYNPITREIQDLTFSERLSDFWDAWSYASVSGFEKSKQFSLSVLPEILFRDMTPLERKIQGDEWADETDRRNKAIRDWFRAEAAEHQRDYEDWVSKHPDLQPKPYYEEGPAKHPDLWADPSWWAYEIASMAPMTLTALATSAIATMATGGNVLAGAVAAGLTFGPVETQGVFEDLIAEGVPREQAAELAALVGVPIILTESAGTYLQFTRFLPQIKRIFRKELSKQLVKLTTRQLAKKGLTTFTTLQFTETMEEVLQEALGNVAVIMAGKDRSLFEGIPELIPKVTAGMLPFSLVGTGVSFVRVSPSMTQGLSEAQMKARGWIQDVKTGKWYQTIQQEEGFVRLYGEPEEVAPRITKETWEAMSVEQRVQQAKQAGLEGKVGSKAYKNLTTEEINKLSQRAVEVPKAEPGKPEERTLKEIWEMTKDIPKMKAVEVASFEREGFIERVSAEEIDTIMKKTLTPEEYEEFSFVVDISAIEKLGGKPTSLERAMIDAHTIEWINALTKILSQEGIGYNEEARGFYRAKREIRPPTPKVPAVPEVTPVEEEIDALLATAKQRREASDPAIRALKPTDVDWLTTEEQTRLEELKKQLPKGISQAEARARVEAKRKARMEAIPKAEPGMPEAGYQPAMFEEVIDREVRPKGKGELTQISMDDQLKLKEAKRQAEEAPEDVREAYEAQAELEGLKVTHELDPVATYRFKMAGRNVGLDSLISIREGTFPSYLTLKQARAIKPFGNFTAWERKGTREYNRVPKEAVLDELADKWNMTVDELADRVVAIRQEKQRIKELQTVRAVETVDEQVARQSEQVKTKLEAEEAFKQKTSSVEAEMEVNREHNLEMVTQPRQEGEIPRQTVRHPSHYRGVEDFNVEAKRELLTGIPESPLDVAATEYLKTGDFSKYIEAMPDVSELKLAALTGEVHTAIEELTTARQLAVEEVTNLRVKKAAELEVKYAEETVELWDNLIAEAEAKRDLFGGLIEKAKRKAPLTVDDAVALGIALRRTKGGKLVAAIRKSGFYVTQEFVDSPYLQNVPYTSGFWQDIDALFEHIDGGRAAGTPDAPAVTQKYIQRPSNRNFLAYKRFLDTYFAQAQDMFERFGLTGHINKQKWLDVFNTIEQITAAEANFKTDQLLRKPEIKEILAEYDIETRHNIVEFAQWTRAFLDEMREMQNQARVKRGQKEIGYIDRYMAWVGERNIWSSLGFSKRTPADMQIRAPAPDYIFPDAPFNPRAMAREGGMKNYPMERNVHKLIFDYIRTAGKDIFFTNTVQNNKIHIAALKAKGLNSTAQLLEEYNAEVWAGAKPRITKAFEAFLPSGIARAAYKIRRNLTRNVFPLNWIWNITIQPSSIAFTVGRTGFINTLKGLDFLFLPSARAFAKDTYSYIIKSKRAGKMAYQDIGQQVEQSLQFEGSLIDKAEFYASIITNTIESLLTGISIRAGFYKGIKLGYTGQELVEYASKMGAKTQSMYNYENVPAVLRSKAVGALFPFQTFCIQAMNFIREMNYIRVGKAGAYETISAKSAEGKATISGRLMLTTAFLISIVVINIVMDKLTNRKPWILSSFIPMFAILQGAVDPGDAWYLPLPAKYINDFWRGFNDAIQYDDYTRLKRWILNYHFPFGGSQINRMIDGIEAVVKGAMEDVKGEPKFEVRPDEWLKAIFMGPYQTEGGREYIDRLDESKEKKAKWYEYLKIPILVGRVDINAEIEDMLAKLGEIDEDGMRYDFGDVASDIREIRRAVGLKRFDKSVSPILDGFKKAEVSREYYESLPPEKLINMDEYDIAGFLFPDPDEKEAEVVELWTKFNTAKTKEERTDIITEYIEANKEELKDNKLAENYGLLQDYWSLTGKDKIAFAKKYDVLSKDWRSEWRRDNPEDDALLAMWGYGGKIQTQEAYDFIIKWCNEYGVDTAHLSTWLPPEGSEENYFKYQQEVLNRSWNSWEAQLILAKDDNLREALGYDPIETPIESLELKVKNRALFDEYDALETDEERDKFRDDHPEWLDDRERIEAYENNGDDFVEKWVERGRNAREFGDNSSEAMLWLLDNPEVYQWAIDNELLTDRMEELRQREPILRINVQFREQDEQYDALTTDAARDAFLLENPTYYEARYRRHAYEKDVPERYHPEYIEWHTSPDLKKPDDWEDRTNQDRWYEDDWYLQEHPEFHQMLVDLGIWKGLKTFENVPTKEVFNKWLEYNRIDSDNRDERYQYRLDNPDLDKWGVAVGIWSKRAEPKPPLKPKEPRTAREKFREALEEGLGEFKEFLESLK